MPRYRTRGGKAHHLLAVDLGMHKVGVAVGYVDGKGVAYLRSADTLQHPKRREASPREVAQMVVDWALQEGWEPRDPVVAEWPMKYENKREVHEDIEALQEVGEALSGLVGGLAKHWRPAQWKGNVPKAAHHKRLWAALTPEARKLVATKFGKWANVGHDAKDAIGIWMFAVGWTKRGGGK